MARISVKATYALDVETVQTLEKIARRWAVSKSEALRRAIRTAASAEVPEARKSIDRLDQLQRALALSPGRAKAWAKQVRAERRARAPKSMPR